MLIFLSRAETATDGNGRFRLVRGWHMSQLTLDFQPALSERFPTLREYIAHRSTVVSKASNIHTLMAKALDSELVRQPSLDLEAA